MKFDFLRGRFDGFREFATSEKNKKTIMKYCYYSDFLLRNYNGGIDVMLKVNGEQYEIKREY